MGYLGEWKSFCPIVVDISLRDVLFLICVLLCLCSAPTATPKHCSVWFFCGRVPCILINLGIPYFIFFPGLLLCWLSVFHVLIVGRSFIIIGTWVSFKLNLLTEYTGSQCRLVSVSSSSSLWRGSSLVPYSRPTYWLLWNYAFFNHFDVFFSLVWCLFLFHTQVKHD